ncbi:xylose isomerase-like protein [Terfezia claveryi]|nr:xylose isomerase-like protein [Terfezia claveryi]
MLPFAPRTPSLPYYLGAHVSMAKGLQNAIHNTLLIGGNSLALFLKSQRRWAAPELTSTTITEFKDLAVQNRYNRKHILPHGSYLINLAQKKPEKHKQAYDAFVDDLKRCEKLEIGLYNFHPGHTGPLQTKVEAMERIAESLNRAHGETSNVITLLENMAGHGSPPIIGSKLEDLRDIIASVKDKSRVGVCIDTCHAFAAGYDLRTHDTFSKFWEEFDMVVGAKYLKAMHLNDSKAPLGGRKDLHQHIGQGYLGLEAFRLMMNSEKMKGIPLILETPMVGEGKSWAEEIKLLESLIGIKEDEEWVLEKSKELQELGRAEMERVGDLVKRREEKVKRQGELKLKREKKVKGEEEVKIKRRVRRRRRRRRRR